MRRNIEKTYRKKKTRTIPTAKIIFLLSIFVVSQVIFFNSDFFRLRTIVIDGARRVSNDDIIKAAGFPWGKNVMTLQLEQCRKKISDMLWIKNVALTKIFPGGVKITVEERAPVIAAAWKGKEDRSFAVDAEGIILCPLSEAHEQNLPLLLVDKEIKQGDKIERSQVELVSKSLTWFSPEISKNICSFMIDKNSSISFNYLLGKKQVEVKLGELDNVTEKMAILDKITKEMAGKGQQVMYVDLRYKEPVVKLIEAGGDKKEPEDNSRDEKSGDTAGGDKPTDNNAAASQTDKTVSGNDQSGQKKQNQ